MKDMLALALARHTGQVLTLEIARQIVREACPSEDRSLNCAQFTPEVSGLYTLQCERVAGLEAELAPLHHGYHQETGHFKDDLNFGYARLREAERAGTVAQFTARITDSRKLVGVMRVRLGYTLESQQLTACDDLFYVDPGHRGSLLAVRLWRYAERAMFSVGVREVTFDSLKITGAEKLAKFLGYTPIAIKFHKVAQDACDYSRLPTRHAAGESHVSLPSL